MNNSYVKTLEPVRRDLEYVTANEELLQLLIEEMRRKDLQVPNWAVPHVHPPLDCGLELWTNFICWINTARRSSHLSADDGLLIYLKRRR